MIRPRKLTDGEVAAALRELTGWSIEGGKLHREFRFGDFSEAFGFMTRAALAAESMNHHPEWFNVWSRVVVVLETHDAGGLTELDFELARRMSAIAAAVSSS
jgi:4a-hydroxytetrahydrobiopterin dehydratase